MDQQEQPPPPVRVEEIAYYAGGEPLAWPVLRRLSLLAVLLGAAGSMAVAGVVAELGIGRLSRDLLSERPASLMSSIQWGLPVLLLAAGVACMARLEAGRRTILVWAVLAAIEPVLSAGLSIIEFWRITSPWEFMPMPRWVFISEQIMMSAAAFVAALGMPWAAWVMFGTRAARAWCRGSAEDSDADAAEAIGRMLRGIGVLSIAAGVCGAASLAMFLFMRVKYPFWYDSTNSAVNWWVVLMIAGCLLAMFAAVGGIGLLRRREWGRRTLIVWAWGAVALTAGSLAIGLFMFSDPRGSGSEQGLTIARQAGAIASRLGTAGVVLMVFGLAAVKERVARRRAE